MSDEQDVPAEILPHAAGLLSEHFGCPVDVVGLEKLKASRTTIVRLKLRGAPVATAICRFGEQGESVWNELAGMRFLAQVPSPPAAVPAFYGGGPFGDDKAIVLSEDIGDAPSLADILLRGTAEEARTAMAGYVDALLDVHLATFGRSAEHAAIRQALKPERPVHEQLGADTWPKLLESLDDGLVPEGAAATVEWIDSVLQPAGPWWAFSLNDCCPDNNQVAPDGRMTLFDLEFSGCRHVLLDLAYVRTFMPTCWCLRRLPVDLSDQLVARYRDRLLGARPELTAAEFERDFAACKAYWAIAPLSWHLDRALTGPKPDERHYFAKVDFAVPSHREVVMLRLADLTAVARERDELAPLGELATNVADHLSTKWPAIEPLPLYPAFS